MRFSEIPGRAASWLSLVLVIVVVVSVVGNMMRASTLATWDMRLPLFGNQMTLTGLFDLQWHLFAVLVMLCGAHAVVQDRHVRVDFLYGKLSPRGKAAMDLAGDLVFLLPFAGVLFWLSLPFVSMAWRSGEGSDYGGLVDRYLIKAIIPIGCAFLFTAGLGRVLVNLSLLTSPADPTPPRDP